MTKLETFLRNVEDIKTKAKAEINTRDTRPEVTALRAKYLGKRIGVLSKALSSFSPETKNEQDLAKHAVKLAAKEIDHAITLRIVEITKLEND